MLTWKKNTKQYPDVWMSHLVQLPGSGIKSPTLLRNHIHPEFSTIRLERKATEKPTITTEQIQSLAAEGGQ